MNLRPAAPDDAEAVARLYLAARVAAVPGVPSSVHPPADVLAWMAGRVVRGDDVWVAEREGRVVGLLVLEPGWIDQLYVDPALTGQGIGSALLELAKRRQPGGLQLWTFESNEGAQRFYERHGFQAAERTDGAGNEERAPDIRYAWRPPSDPLDVDPLDRPDCC